MSLLSAKPNSTEIDGICCLRFSGRAFTDMAGAIQRTGRTRATIYCDRSRGRLPSTRTYGRYRLYALDELDALAQRLAA